MQKIQPRPYKKYVAKLREQDAVTGENYKNSKWANYFMVDASDTVRNGRAYPNHLFELFGSFSSHTSAEVRIHLLKNIASDTSFYKEQCAACLQSKSITFEMWVVQLADECVFCDELALMGLCNLYRRHCVVLTQNKLWSGIQADAPMNLLDLLKECSIRLIYLGNQRFRDLMWRLRLTKKVASKSPGFNIVEEYTLYEVIDSTKQATNTNKVCLEAAGNVVTSGGDDKVATVHKMVNNYPVKETVEIKPKAREPSGAKPLHVVTETEVRSAPTTDAEQTTLTMPPTKPATTKPHPVICPEDGIILSQYPWKSELEVHLERVSEIESDIWCNRVMDNYKFTSAPEVTTVISDIKGYGFRKRQIKEEFLLEDQSQSDTTATDKLIDQAKALINTAKTFVTKPVKRKHGSKSGPSPPSTSKTKPKDNTLDALQEQTVRNLTTLHVGTDRSMKPSTKVPLPP